MAYTITVRLSSEDLNSLVEVKKNLRCDCKLLIKGEPVKSNSKFLILIIILVLFSSCVYHPHYVCEYVSDKELYVKTLKGNIFDSSFEEYTVGEDVFVLIPESTLCYTKSKTDSQCRFVLTVFSKSESYAYNIDGIRLVLDGIEHDLYEYQIYYYPYDTETYTSFEKVLSYRIIIGLIFI